MNTPRLDETFSAALRAHLVCEVAEDEARPAPRNHRPMLLGVVAAVAAVVVGMAVLGAGPWVGDDDPSPANDSDPAIGGYPAILLPLLNPPDCDDPRTQAEVRTCIRELQRQHDGHGAYAPGELDPQTEEWLEAIENGAKGELSIMVEGPEALAHQPVEECRLSLANGTSGPLHPLYCNALVLMADGVIRTGHHYMEDELRDLPEADTSLTSTFGSVAGTFRVVGGPAPGIDKPVVGTITFDGPIERSIRTDSEGTFFAVLPPGNYSVTGVDRTGFYPTSACPAVQASIGKGNKARVDVACVVE